MTTKKKEETANQATRKPPEGFERGGRPEIDGWYKPEDGGNIVTGQIVGQLSVPGKSGPREAVVITLTEACEGYAEKKKIVLEAGQNIGLTVPYDLLDMLSYVEHKGSVWFRATGKKELKGGNTLWKFEQYYKGKKSRPLDSAYDGEAPF